MPLRMAFDHQAGLKQRRVLPRVIAGAALVHRPGAGDEGANVHARDGGGNKAHRAKLGEASAHAVGDVEGLIALLAGDFDEKALVPGGGDDDMAAVIVANGLFQMIEDDEVLAHGLGRAAGLGDDVEAGGLQVDDVQKRRHALGVDIVFDIQTRAAALLLGQLVVMQVPQRLMHGRRAKRGAADAQNDEGLELVAHTRGHLLDGRHDIVLVIGQRHPALHALAAVCLHHGVRVAHRGDEGFHLRAGNAVFANVLSHHRVKIEANGLHTVSSVYNVIILLYDTWVKFATTSGASGEFPAANFPTKIFVKPIAFLLCACYNIHCSTSTMSAKTA